MKHLTMFCLCLAMLPAWGGRSAETPAAAPAALEQARQDYDKKLQQIRQESEGRAKALPGGYLKALDATESAFRTKGDLDAVMAVRGEKERFNKDPAVAKESLVEKPRELRDLQVQFQNEVARQETDENQKTMATAQTYMATLASLEKELTKQGKLDEAMQVRAEREGVPASAVYRRAEFILTDAAARATQAPRNAGAPSPVPPAAPEKLESWDDVGGPDVVIHEQARPALDGTKFLDKRLDATPTEHGRLLNRISARLLLGEKQVNARNRQFLKAQLGSVSTERPTAKPTLVVDYYAKAAGAIGKGDTKDPMKIRTELIRLPNLVGDKRVVAETAGIADAWDLYGLIVSVYDGKNQLVYQVATRPGLKDLAPAQMPEAAYETSQTPPPANAGDGDRVVAPQTGAKGADPSVVRTPRPKARAVNAGRPSGKRR